MSKKKNDKPKKKRVLTYVIYKLFGTELQNTNEV